MKFNESDKIPAKFEELGRFADNGYLIKSFSEIGDRIARGEKLYFSDRSKKTLLSVLSYDKTCDIIGQMTVKMTPEEFLETSWHVTGILGDGNRIEISDKDETKSRILNFDHVMGLLVKLHFQGYGDDIEDLL